MALRQLKLGETVGYAVGESVPGQVEVRAARVVRTWIGQEGEAQTPNLMVKFDGTNDEDFRDELPAGGNEWQTSVPYNAEKHVGTWHLLED